MNKGTFNGLSDWETVRAPIQDALFATNRFLTDEATELAEGILTYLMEAGYWPVKIPEIINPNVSVAAPEMYKLIQMITKIIPSEVDLWKKDARELLNKINTGEQ